MSVCVCVLCVCLAVCAVSLCVCLCICAPRVDLSGSSAPPVLLEVAQPDFKF